MDHKSEMEITVWEKKCWICGETRGHITSHHTLPKHLKPKKNFICPICERCHDKLNQEDYHGIIAFAFKIQASFNELSLMVENMIMRMKSKRNVK